MAEDEFDMSASKHPEQQDAEAARREREKERHAHSDALFIDMIIEKAKRDCISYPDKAFSLGHMRGLERGKNYKARSIAKNLLETNLPLETIITATGLTRNEIENLRN